MMRTFTRSELVDWFKSNMDWSQNKSEIMTDFLFKARKKGAKDIKKRKKRMTTGKDWGSLPKARGMTSYEKKFWKQRARDHAHMMGYMDSSDIEAGGGKPKKAVMKRQGLEFKAGSIL